MPVMHSRSISLDRTRVRGTNTADRSAIYFQGSFQGSHQIFCRSSVQPAIEMIERASYFCALLSAPSGQVPGRPGCSWAGRGPS